MLETTPDENRTRVIGMKTLYDKTTTPQELISVVKDYLTTEILTCPNPVKTEDNRIERSPFSGRYGVQNRLGAIYPLSSK